MIHALAQEDAQERRKERREQKKRRKAKKHHRHASHSADDDAGDEQKKEKKEGSNAGDESNADLSKFRSLPERAAANPSLARCDNESPKSTVSSAQRQLLSGSATSASSHLRHQRPNIRAGGRDGEDLSKSSIFAIHRPIAAERRRTMSSTHGTDDESGEPDLAEQDEEYKDEGVRLRRAGKEEGKRPEMGDRTETSATEKTVETMERRQKLAEKLMDVFGLEEPEEVVAGASLPNYSTNSDCTDAEIRRVRLLALPLDPPTRLPLHHRRPPLLLRLPLAEGGASQFLTRCQRPLR